MLATRHLSRVTASLALLAMLAPGCQIAPRYDRTRHTIERWEPVPSPSGSPRAILVYRERWVDVHTRSFGGLFTDPNVTAFIDTVTNQPALGGGSSVRFGSAASTVDSKGIEAAGTAAGNVIGAAVKSAVK